jgi:hypothetical protein
MEPNVEVLIGFGLFALSELIGMSKYKENSVIQAVLRVGSEVFPYELKRRDKKRNRPRDRHGRFLPEDEN